MGSQTDLDMGGTSRQWTKTYMGPTVGWVNLPGRNPLIITAGGTYTLQPETSLVEINVAAAVTVILQTAIDPSVPAGAQPGLYAKTPVTIADIGGNAGTYNITIQPASGAENIMGLASIQLLTAYGSYSLRPDNTLKGWTAAQ